MSRPPALAVRGLHKRFGGVHALRGVDLTIRAGTVHCLVGENGAGKSTLGRILAGVYQPDEGTLFIDGELTVLSSPRDGLAHNVSFIAQEITVVPDRSVAENLLLGREPHRLGIVRRDHERELVSALQRGYGLDIDPRTRLRGLRQAERQKVEILRALARDAQTIIMDEPTAALAADEAQRLRSVIVKLRQDGKTVVLISHHLDDVLEVADDISILRNGELVRTAPRSRETAASLVEGMLGRPLEQTFPPKVMPPHDARPVLEARDVAAPPLVSPTSLRVRSGEILGLVGLVGSGRTELARAVYGADATATGTVLLDGRPVPRRTPRRSVKAGLAMLPESRKEQGLLMARSIHDNTCLAATRHFARFGVLRPGAERPAVTAALTKADTRYESLQAAVGQLSGGNQQKVLFSRWLLVPPKVLIVDEPTRGVDVGAKVRIHRLIAELAAEGLGVLLISSESEEVFGLAHRILAMKAGRVVGAFDGPQFDRDQIMNSVLEERGEA